MDLHECRGRRDAAGRGRHTYPSEADARAALAAIYQLSQFLEPLPTWDEQQLEPGRWRVRVYAPAAGAPAAATASGH